MYRGSAINIISYLATLTCFLKCNGHIIPPPQQLNGHPECTWPPFPQPYTAPLDATHDPGTNEGDDEPAFPLHLNKRIEDITSDSDFHSLSPRASIDANTIYADAVIGGRELWRHLQTVLSITVDLPPLCQDDFTSRWYASSPTDPPTSTVISEIWSSLLPHLAAPPAGTLPPSTQHTWSYAEIVSPKPPLNARFYYKNLYSVTSHTIIAVHIKGRALNFDRDGEPIPHSESIAPDRWSDVTWSYWNSLCASERAAGRSADPGHLQWVLQQHIINEQTSAIIDRVLLQRATLKELPAPFYATEVRTLSLSDGDEFFALLRTPNVIGTVFVLMDYKSAFGGGVGKTLKGITVARTETKEYPGGYFLAIELEEQHRAGDQNETISTA